MEPGAKHIDRKVLWNANLGPKTEISLWYLGVDLLVLSQLWRWRFYFACFETSWILGLPGYIIWSGLMGLFMWALFVVGHDCGHGSFSQYSWLNTLCGHVAHTPLLVPYSAWRNSHYLHHIHHNNIDKDHSWKPLRKEVYDSYTGIWKFMRFSKALLFLFPIYLLSDAEDASGNHFNPASRLFTNTKERQEAIIGTSSVMSFLSIFLYQWGFYQFLVFYLPAYLVFVAWLDLVTYLHHTDVRGTYYSDETWTFTKGAETTFDRSYGPLLDHITHHIGYHSVHHITPKAIPHYHLKRASEMCNVPIRHTSIWQEFLVNQQTCHYVEKDSGEGVNYRRDSS